MPDWTYQTVFRPVLRRLPYPVAQTLVFQSMGRLGRTAIGRAIIRFMGHAQPHPLSGFEKNEEWFVSRCGLACGVDQDAKAVSAQSLFGFGLLEVGPVCVGGHLQTPIAAAWEGEGVSINADSAIEASSLRAALLNNNFRSDVKVVARFRIKPEATAEQLQETAELLADVVDGFVVELDKADRPALAAVQTLQILRADGKFVFFLQSGVENERYPDNADGVILEARDPDGNRGDLSQEAHQQLLARIPHKVSDSQLLIVSGGVREPADGMKLLAAGADMVLVDSGFAASGPGLPKRINSAIHAEALRRASGTSNTKALAMSQQSWFWAFLMGISLTVGGLLALIVGSTRVVLPYDEEFLGMLREEICSLNDQLLPFMSHDRVTVAGTMLSLGPLYLCLAWFGDRRGQHWARVAVLASSFVGFLSFFLFLGFGYFDPFHAFISAVLFQFVTHGLRSGQTEDLKPPVDLRNTSAWRRAMWGQLLMVIQGAAIMTAGVVISSFSVTSVFVQTDLDFMQTTREALVDANARLVPVVAHDRAAFGGMLMATGITVFLTALWGWRKGQRWLWHALLWSGTTSYVTTIAIHWYVGYTSLLHLTPAYGGLAGLWLAMLLARSWMCEPTVVKA